MEELVQFLIRWSNRWRERTWLIHSIFALPIAAISVLLYLQLLHWKVHSIGAVAIVVTFAYFIAREMEQRLYGVAKDWLDQVLDVVAPTSLVTLLVLVVQWIVR